MKKQIEEWLPIILVIGGAIKLFWEPSWATLEFEALALAFLALKGRWTSTEAFTALKGDIAKLSGELDKLKTAISIGSQRKF